MSVPVWMVIGLLGCSGGEPASAPPPVAAPAPPPAPAAVPLPDLALAPATRDGVLATPIPSNERLAKARTTLHDAVQAHGRDPGNPWAVGHALLALGPDIELTHGVKAVDHLFAAYAERVPLEGGEGVRFPRSRGDVRIEPHTDLLLKAFTEGGVAPDRTVEVQGTPVTVDRLWRHSLRRAWVSGTATGFDAMNDSPWALQALAQWAPPGARWTAEGGHAMDMDTWTSASVAHLVSQGRALQAAKDAGTLPPKDGKGILSYTCGGQHFLQGTAHAVARGFGTPDDRARICGQRDLLRWRIDHELASIDPVLAKHGRDPNVAIVLLDQRMKFLGHYLESAAKIGAYELCPWTDDDAAALQRAADELVRTVEALDGLGVWRDLQAVRNNRGLDPYRPDSGGAEQVYLDLLGDAAHAVRGIDLATGAAHIRY